MVIPVFNGSKTIPKTLSALFSQEDVKKGVEILVINDGSTDNTAQIVSEFKGVKLVSQANAGPAVARNRGARLAKGEIVIFLDADCVPEKNWFSEMIAPFSDPRIVGVQGKYKNPIHNLMAEFVQLEIEERYERMARQDYIDFIGSYSAGYRKKVFLEEGGFDEKYRIASGEDPDFSYKLADKGYKMVFAPKAMVAHYHPTSLVKYWKTKFFRAYWRFRMYSKNPGKIKGDSYTNPFLKFQTGFMLATMAFGLVTLAAIGFRLNSTPFVLAGAFFLLATLATTWPTSVFMLRKNIPIGIVSLVLLPVNAFLFATGLVAGGIGTLGGKK